MLAKRCLAAGLVLLLLGFSHFVRAEGLPGDIPPLPPELAKRNAELLQAAEEYRGLKAKKAVPSGAADETLLKKKMLELFAEEMPAAKIYPLESALKAFGFVPLEMNVGKYFPELLTSQVGGFYDSKRKYLVLVKRGGLQPKDLGGKMPEGMAAMLPENFAQRADEMVMVHELTHAIQDQHFNLEKLADSPPFSDAGAAHVALVEGDATLTMYDFLLQMRLEKQPAIGALFKNFASDPAKLAEMAPDLPGAKELIAAPPWFRDTLLFSYLQGFNFCREIKQLGGQKLLDYAFTQDPPRSTEQIMHPEKWHGQRDDPKTFVWPGLAAALPGFKLAARGELGEASVRTLLKSKLNDAVAAAAAAGWGGDEFAVYEKDGDRLLVWVSEWDTPEDAREFKDAAGKLGADWRVSAESPKRVSVVRGKISAAALDAVRAKLQDALVQNPENKPVDFAALGIQPEKETAGGGIEDLLNSPLVKEMAGKLLKGEDGGKSKSADGIEMPGNMDLGELMNNPMVKDMLKGMLSQEHPEGEVSADGQKYSNAQLGFSLQVPGARKDWKIDSKPSVPMAAVVISSPDGSVQISVIGTALPIAVPLEMVGPQLEMGPKMVMQNYKKLGGGPFEKNGQKGYELQYEGSQGGMTMRLTQRVFLQGATMLALSAAVNPSGKWAEHEKAITEILDSLKTFAPQAPAQK